MPKLLEVQSTKDFASTFLNDIFFKMAVNRVLDAAPKVDAVRIPCRIGDTVWGIRKYNTNMEAMQGKVFQMLICEGTTLCICVKNVCRGEWGKTVFATKEETLAAIERLKEARL